MARSFSFTIAVLRGSLVLKEYIGLADIQVWFALSKKGYRVHIFLHGKDNVEEHFNGVSVWKRGLLGLPIVSHCVFCLLSFFKILRINPHVLVVNYLSYPVGVVYKILRRNSIVILDIRTVPVGERAWLHNLFLKNAFHSRFFDGLTIITESMLKFILKVYGVRKDLKYTVWGSGFDPSLFNEHRQGDHIRRLYGRGKRFVFIYHGIISRERKLDFLINAIKLLYDEGIRDICLWMLGDGNDRIRLQKLVSKLGLEDVIIFLDPVPYSQVGEYIAGADACICPLPDEPKWRYQFPLKVVECLAIGKPVIASDILAHRQIGRGIILYRGDNPQALADAIKKFISLSDVEKEELKREALKTAKNYSWENQAAKIDTFLKRLLKEKSIEVNILA